MALPLIGIAGAIAASLAVPVGKLTLKMIRNAKIPVRYKKALQGVTKGEKQIAPTVKSSRQTAIQEAKASIATIGALVGGEAIVKQIHAAAKKAGASEKPKSNKNKVAAGSRSKTNQARKTKTDKVLEKALKPKKRPISLRGEPPRRPSAISKLKRGG
tara:strand:- start:46 stop:519 length:474 start_codon:yes stop_codon:yes gene_type:complete